MLLELQQANTIGFAADASWRWLVVAHLEALRNVVVQAAGGKSRSRSMSIKEFSPYIAELIGKAEKIDLPDGVKDVPIARFVPRE